MKNVKELREELIDLYQNVKSDATDVEKAKVLVSASNSMLKSAALELDHKKMTGSKKEIDFLKS